MILRSLVLAALALVGGATTAQADLKFCNQSSSKQFVAAAFRKQGQWTSKGWYTLQPGACATVFGEDLRSRYYYYHVDVTGEDFEGDYSFCVTTKAFEIAGASDCVGRGYRKERFRQIDTGPSARHFTMHLAAAGGSARIKPPTGLIAYGQPRNDQTVSDLLFNFEHVKVNLQSLRTVSNWTVGPFQVGSSCSWSCGFLDLESCGASWQSTQDFNWTHEELIDWIATTQVEVAWIEKQIGYKKGWHAVPNNWEAYFNYYLDSMKAAGQKVESGAMSPSDARVQMDSAISLLKGAISSIDTSLKDLTRDMARHLDLLSARREAIKQYIRNSHERAISQLDGDQAESKTHRCQGGVAQQWTDIRNFLNGRHSELNRWFEPLQVSMGASETQLAALVQSVSGAQGKLRTLEKMLVDIERAEPGSFEQSLYVSAAQNQWAALNSALNTVWN